MAGYTMDFSEKWRIVCLLILSGAHIFNFVPGKVLFSTFLNLVDCALPREVIRHIRLHAPCVSNNMVIKTTLDFLKGGLPCSAGGAT